VSVRSALTLLAVTCLFAIPVATAGGPAVVAAADGGAHWTIPLPNQFGVEVGNRTLAFNARAYADGSVAGRFEYQQVADGEAFKFSVAVTCLKVYDGYRAKLGAVV
jgi:hypothetical protein